MRGFKQDRVISVLASPASPSSKLQLISHELADLVSPAHFAYTSPRSSWRRCESEAADRRGPSEPLNTFDPNNNRVHSNPGISIHSTQLHGDPILIFKEEGIHWFSRRGLLLHKQG
ncbi:hypothetical protein Q8A67_017818 [Cirrhinus molitorella]|uniref:Uncharacterized protein n=1 Tax=Cirrhinus molitorella TaxID=172907 RepID=A0AA88PFJ1_9TELE|nr:hypothetical protein Q8A67_017818 [Cirrhinus molitorella]